MTGRTAAGDGALDLLAVQRDDELLDLLGARTPVSSDDELVGLLVAWRDEVDDELPGVVPVQRAASPVPVAAAVPAARLSGTPVPSASVDLLPGVGAGRPRRRRLTATGTAAALVLGGTLSLSGVAAAVTGDPLAPYRAVGHALKIGGDSLPAQAADVAQLNKRLSRARAAVAHGDTAGAQAAVDGLTAQLASADLTDQQRAAIERRLAALRATIARVAASDAERGRSSDRATAVATPPTHDENGPAAGDPKGGDAQGDGAQGDGSQGDGNNDGDATGDDATDRVSGSTKATEPAAKATDKTTSKPSSKPTVDRPDPVDGGPQADAVDPVPTDPGDQSGGGDHAGDQSAGTLLDRGGTGGRGTGGGGAAGRSQVTGPSFSTGLLRAPATSLVAVAPVLP